MQGAEENDPAPGTEPVAEVGAGERDEDEERRDGAELVAEGAPVEGGVAAGEPEDQDEENEEDRNEGARREEAFAGRGRWRRRRCGDAGCVG
jgi:hypothetical protein